MQQLWQLLAVAKWADQAALPLQVEGDEHVHRPEGHAGATDRQKQASNQASLGYGVWQSQHDLAHLQQPALLIPGMLSGQTCGHVHMHTWCDWLLMSMITCRRQWVCADIGAAMLTHVRTCGFERHA